MSTRWYPIYQRGNPQLRVFLPNFWMKLVKPKEEIPPNRVHFHVSPEMSEYDVKNYLEKIYNLPVMHVEVELMNGDLKRSIKNFIIKEDDYKLAQVTLERGQSFTFPHVKLDKDVLKKQSEQVTQDYKKFEKSVASRPSLPGWFSA